MTSTLSRRDLMAEMTVDLPEGEYETVAVRKFTVEKDSLANLRLAIQPGARACIPGEYTMLTRNGHLWMSDTTAERRDHIEPAIRISRGATSVLIGGLGLGCILQVALRTPGMQHVDVVEIDPAVVALVGPHYEKMAADHGVTLTIHQADLMEISWPKGTRWDVAWFDIWANLCTDDLAEHATLARRYTRRTGWYGCWGHELLVSHRRREGRQRYGW